MYMKKILFTLLLVLVCQMVSAQTATSVFNEFRNEKKSEYVSVPRAMMTIAAARVKDGNIQALLKEVKSAKILTLDECRKGVRKDFVKKISALTSNGYEEYTRMKDKKDNTLILAKKEGQYISEIVALMSDENDCSGILITGQINPEDIEAVVGMVED